MWWNIIVCVCCVKMWEGTFKLLAWRHRHCCRVWVSVVWTRYTWSSHIDGGHKSTLASVCCGLMKMCRLSSPQEIWVRCVFICSHTGLEYILGAEDGVLGCDGCVTGWLVPSIWKDHAAFIFQGQAAQEGLHDPGQCRQHSGLRHWDLMSQQHSITAARTGVTSSTAVRCALEWNAMCYAIQRFHLTNTLLLN
jgi:hypothetical protein